MRMIAIVIAAGLFASACSKGKTCTPQSAEVFIGKDVPDPQLAAALKDVATHNKVCGTTQTAQLVMSGARSQAVDALDLAMKKAGFHDVPGRDRSEGSVMILSYFKAKDAVNGNLVELGISTGDDCRAGDVCVENRGYSVQPN